MIAAIAVAATVFGLIVEDIYKFISTGGEAKTVIGSLIDTFLEFTGLGNVFSFIGEGIDYAIQGMKQLAGIVGKFSFGSVGEGIGDFFSGISDGSTGEGISDFFGGFGAPSALAGIPLAAGGGTSINNGSNTTNNNTTSVTTEATINTAATARDVEDVLNQQNANAARDNSTGIER